MDEMPYEELLGWINYFERRPVGWREDDRTFKLLQVQGFKGRPESVFHSLAMLHNKPEREDGKMDMNSFKGSSVYHFLSSATGGDKIDL